LSLLFICNLLCWFVIHRSSSDSAKEAWPFTNHKFSDPFGGFQQKEGTWQDLTFGVQRVSSDTFHLWVSSNGLSYNQSHKWTSSEKDWIPQQIDSVGIIYPNERGYAFTQMKMLGPSPGPSPGPSGDWKIVDNWNSIPTGTPTTESSLKACESVAAGANQFTFNHKSGHCYVSNATAFGGLANANTISGCIASKVTNCGVTV
jgi:hypothetical protein